MTRVLLPLLATLSLCIAPTWLALFDVGTDFTQEYPYIGPAGSVHWAEWNELNPEHGSYNWSIIYTRLEQEAGLTVKYWGDSKEHPKPVQVMIAVHLSPTADHGWIDSTPRWVYRESGKSSYTVQCGAETIILPTYDCPIWQARLFEFWAAFAEEFRDNSQIDSIVLISGLDCEPHMVKPRGCMTCLNEQYPGLEYRFGQYLDKTIETSRMLFPRTPLFFNMAPGGTARCSWAALCAEQTPPVGLKFAGMTVDGESWVSDELDCNGALDALLLYQDQVPICLESKSGMCSEETAAWIVYACLGLSPDAVSLHYDSLNPSFFDKAPEGLLRWAAAHLGKPISDMPSVWLVARDEEYASTCWGSGDARVCVGGYPDCWSQGLTLIEEHSQLERLWRTSLPEEVPAATDFRSRQWLDGFLAIDVSEEYLSALGYIVTVEWYDDPQRVGQSWLLEYYTSDGKLRERRVQYEGTGRWRTLVLKALDLRIDQQVDISLGEVGLHKIEVSGFDQTLVGTSTPTSSSTVVVATATATATQTPPGSATPSATCLPSCTPTVSATFTPSIGKLAQELAGRMWQLTNELGYVRWRCEGVYDPLVQAWSTPKCVAWWEALQ